MPRTLAACAMVLAVLAMAPRAGALEQKGAMGDLRFTVFAPDWTWQKQNVNVLIVLENTGARAFQAAVELEFPRGKENHFKADGATTAVSCDVPPGETVRRALTDIYAVDGVPRQVYDFTLVVRSEQGEVRVPYPLQTIRGAAVSSARWAVYLPVALALAWSVLFALIMPRYGARGAWRTPSTQVLAEGLRDGDVELNAARR